MARFCENCGASLNDTAKFCSSCGQAILPIPTAKEQPVASHDNTCSKQTKMQAIIELIKRHKAKEKKEPQDNPRAKGNGAYVRWFLFYFFFFSIFMAGIAIPIYIITTIIAFTKSAEKLWRKVSGVRPLRLRSEKERLLPLFKEVYLGATEVDLNISKGIKLYIKEDMTINAFAFGKSTLVLTRGSLELLDDDCLKGFIAHEFGHFSHGDTKAILLAIVSNYFMSKIIVKLTDRVNRYEAENRSGFIVWIVRGIYRLFKAIDFIGEVILQRTSRRNEYLADSFALKSGFGSDLAKVLIEIYSVSVSKPQSVKEQLKSTHPDITLRIERLEEALYQ